MADIYLASNVEEGFEIYRTKGPQIIILDLNMPPMSAMEMIEGIRQKDKETTIILLSNNRGQNHFIKAIEIGINRYVPRPVNRDELLETIIVEADKILLREDIKPLKGDMKTQGGLRD